MPIRSHTITSRHDGPHLMIMLLLGWPIPFAGSGWAMVALLCVAGAGILGLHPYYYVFTQELSAIKMEFFPRCWPPGARSHPASPKSCSAAISRQRKATNLGC